MRERRFSLPHPSTPPDLPHGLQRGGIFDVPWAPSSYIDAVRMTVPTDSPDTHDVPENIFAMPVDFADPAQPVEVTGGERALGAYHGFGAHRMIQGMGPQPGFIMEPVGAPPLPIRSYRPIHTTHGTREGGIFGQERYMPGKTGLRHVPQAYPQLQKDIYVERNVKAITGYGAGPDGLGRWR